MNDDGGGDLDHSIPLDTSRYLSVPLSLSLSLSFFLSFFLSFCHDLCSTHRSDDDDDVSFPLPLPPSHPSSSSSASSSSSLALSLVTGELLLFHAEQPGTPLWHAGRTTPASRLPPPPSIRMTLPFGASAHDFVRDVCVVGSHGGVTWSAGKHNAALWHAASGCFLGLVAQNDHPQQIDTTQVHKKHKNHSQNPALSRAIHHPQHPDLHPGTHTQEHTPRNTHPVTHTQ